MGGEPGDAWRRLASMPGAGPLARLLERAGVSGPPAAVPVTMLAAEARADRARTATARPRRAAVLVTAPVGPCQGSSPRPPGYPARVRIPRRHRR